MAKRILLVGTVIGLLALLIMGLLQSGVLQWLRTQVVPVVPTKQQHQFSWTPTITTPPGQYTLQVVATDARGNRTTRDVTVTVVAPSPSTVPSISPAPVVSSSPTPSPLPS